MSRRSPCTQATATRLFKAASAAGFERARLVIHPDGRIEVIGETGACVETPVENAFDRRMKERLAK